ncbi:LacI family DNA-binding transcriptional regulator [Levilactobacillus acidifarinae]|uniref:LacI family transcriptional regulator n=1 Tax=Levilactobacillus acidifarinae DSM 19394 = JCM 15949 TaxID=1423715 RepID=A0A0R1LT26_9LACO|nr:LacI family DNA-binding transcriptional regulator [Levilactobacillus acidifarinae]KRK95961.1 LacI family transcriptional regulator [Levilactobacillus acidifarinae DSM 19394]GEO69266.1 LacI family transcriptional regulator [Levilactobacillus acidifarinae]
MRVTIKDIAKETGLAPSTVSMILNKKSFRVSDATRKRVLETADRLGYVSNKMAVNLQKQITTNIGLIVPDIRNDFYASFAKGAEQKCRENNWGLLIANSDNNQQREEEYINSFYQQNVSGIIMARATQGENIGETSFIKMKKLGITHVLLDFSGTDVSNVVAGNHFRGGYVATSHLIDLGHRKIACITGDLRLEGAQTRLAGYKQALLDHHLNFDSQLVFESDYTYENTMKIVKQMNLNKFTGVFAFNDLMALAFINYAKAQNYTVPIDFSVIGYDDIFLTQIMHPQLTTMQQPILKMGSDAASIIIKNPIFSGKRHIKKYEPILIKRETTSTPNRQL